MKQLGFVFLLLGLTAASARALPSDARLVTLGNGMRLLLAPDSTAAVVDVGVWYDAGTRHEREGITGISHLFEHMMFRGSANFGPGEHVRLIQAEGGSVNAFTTSDLACYYQTVPREALELPFRLEADRIASLRLTQEGLDVEKEAVREQKRALAERGATGVALQGLYRLAYPAHPYRWPIMGLDEDLERLTLADCQAYFDGHYAPNNATFVVVGAFDPQEALQLARKWLEPLKKRTVKADGPRPEPAQSAERRAWERTGTPGPLLAVGWRAAGHPDADTPALLLLARILFTGPSARLQRALVSPGGGCLSVLGGLDGRRDSQLFYVVAALRPGADSAAVERRLTAEIETLAREPVGAEEFDRALRQEELGTLFSWQTAHGRAESLGSAWMVDSDWRAAQLRLERMRTLAPADLQRAAARALKATVRSVCWVVPAGPAAPGGDR